MSAEDDAPSAPDSGDELFSEEELAEAAAAVTLATLPEGERLPPALRERVEASGRAILGQRAKLHARRRAEERAHASLSELQGAKAPSSIHSTTSAGAQVVGMETAAVGPKPARLVTWTGWAFAAAACLALYVTRTQVPQVGTPAASGSLVQLVGLVGPDEGAAELQYDRSAGAGTLRVRHVPAVDPERPRLELWVTLEGETTARAVTLFDGAADELLLVPGQIACHAAPAALPSPAPCVAIRDVTVTREGPTGSLVLEPRRVVLRSRGAP